MKNRSELVTKHIRKRRYLLVQPFYYRVTIYGRDYCLFVPKGFVTDLASVPQILWSFGLSPSGPWIYAAVIHDWLCEYKGYIRLCDNSSPTSEVIHLTSREAHKLFDRINQVEEVNWFVRTIMHRAISLFGPRWKDDEKPYMLPEEIPEKPSPDDKNA